VAKLTCRLLPFGTHVGAWNMAADEALLHSATEGRATLRFYGWSEPTLSLGYFQRADDRLRHPLLGDLPWLRRPSGGGALVHDCELTYALAIPAVPPWTDLVASPSAWIEFMHRIIASVLRRLLVRTSNPSPKAADAGQFLCFACLTEPDVVLQGKKIVGSAQRRHRGALLQHGGILLARSRFTPELPGIEELATQHLPSETLAAAIANEFAVQTGMAVATESLTDIEEARIRELFGKKYSQLSWNAKR
jgi:lipoyl(octanoyl) transferase